MIPQVFRTSLLNLRRDRAALVLSFIVPLAFFSIFAGIFGRGSGRNSTPRVKLVLADQDGTANSQRFVDALSAEHSLDVRLAPDPKAPKYTAQTAEAAVRAGEVPVAVIIPQGFGSSPIAFGPRSTSPKIQLLADTSDPIAPQLVNGLLQKVAMTAMPDVMAEQGGKYIDQFAGGMTPEQKRQWSQNLEQLRQRTRSSSSASDSGGSGGIVQVETRDIFGEKKKNPIIAFYAAGLGVMFLLFTASGASGALLEESENGTLDRVLSSRVSMTTLLLGKLVYLTCLGVTQLIVMFTWGALVFKLDFAPHLVGFGIMAVTTAMAVAAFALLLASSCRTRAQLGALSTLVVLVISAIGGSMFPRFLMPESMQRFSLIFFNSWALDGFLKVFWRGEPLRSLWPQVTALLAFAAVFFVAARRLSRRWELA